MNQIKNVPVYLVYCVFSVVFVADYNLNTDISRNILDIVWGGLFLCASTFAYAKLIQSFKLSEQTVVFIFLTSIITSIYLVKYLAFQDNFYLFDVLAFAMEMKIFFYAFFSVVWLYVFRDVDVKSFSIAGVFLSIVIIVSVLIESILNGGLVRGHGSGEINYDALLLLLALVASLFGHEKVSKKVVYIILLGLLITLSRTSLIVLAFVVFFYTNINFYKKILVFVFSISLVVSSFVLRDLEVDLSKVDRFAMYESAYHGFSKDSNFFGNFPGLSIDLETPEQLNWLWNKQSEEHGLSGLYPFHLHAMWLRFHFTFGLIVSSAIFFYFIYSSILSKNKLRRVLSFVIVMQGLTMGVFYISNVSIPLILLYLSTRYMATGEKASVLRRFQSKY